MKLAGRVLDILDEPVDDRGRLLKEASAGGVSIPQFVLVGDPPSAADEIPDELFAFNDGSVKKYACDTKANTWVSGLYFLRNGHAFPAEQQQKIANTMLRFYFTHGIKPPILLSKIASGEQEIPVPEERAESQNFAIEKTSSEGRPMYPIDTWEQLEKAAEYFISYADKHFDLKQRREFCVKLAERVRKLTVEDGIAQGRTITLSGAPGEELRSKVAGAVVESRDPATALPEMVQKYASNVFDRRTFKIAMAQRLIHANKKAPGSVVEDTYKTLLENYGSLPVDKIATTLERIDRGAGYSHLWGDKFPDPYLSVLKIASDPFDRVVFEDRGVQLTERQVRKIAEQRTKIAEQWDEGFAQDFCSSPDPVQVFNSLPRTDKLLLAQLA